VAAAIPEACFKRGAKICLNKVDFQKSEEVFFIGPL